MIPLKVVATFVKLAIPPPIIKTLPDLTGPLVMSWIIVFAYSKVSSRVGAPEYSPSLENPRSQMVSVNTTEAPPPATIVQIRPSLFNKTNFNEDPDLESSSAIYFSESDCWRPKVSG
ncbi:hypothetical protein RF11_02490 [Thelohanellus kitauei]|uniref:Uncharacterized protein n=1 Tax=Thelohanellus kitauei TaxID=669202 RepID=A0A0C2MMU3_THEKT|nr:hypothetical protein RF11_02490 [Thelohanellus kitauei]